MVLKINSILALEDWHSKYHVTDITKTQVTIIRYNECEKPYTQVFGRKSFESYKWKRAKVKWY